MEKKMETTIEFRVWGLVWEWRSGKRKRKLGLGFRAGREEWTRT